MVDKAWKIKQDVKYCIRRLKGGDGKKKKKKSSPSSTNKTTTASPLEIKGNLNARTFQATCYCYYS